MRRPVCEIGAITAEGQAIHPPVSAGAPRQIETMVARVHSAKPPRIHDLCRTAEQRPVYLGKNSAHEIQEKIISNLPL